MAARAANPTRIVVAGDLVASSHATARPPRTGWAQVLDRYTDLPVLLMSAAERARASRMAAGLEPGASELAAGDLMLIQLPSAADDGSNLAPAETESQALRQLLATARASGARPVLVGTLARREFSAEGRALPGVVDRDELLRTLAAKEGLVFIDLAARSRTWVEALGPEASKSWYFHDPATGYSDVAELHERGAYAVACLVMTELVSAQALVTAQLTRTLDCALPAPADGARKPVLEHIDAVPQHGIERHGSSGLAVAAQLFKGEAAGVDVARMVLHAGAAVGVHQHPFDEVFYVISGRAELSVDGQAHQLMPGSAMLIPSAAAHSLRQTGPEDLVVLSIQQRPN